MLAIKNGRFETVTKGTCEGYTLLVDGGKIVDFGKNVKIPKGAEIIDGTGKWIVPGFIDAHTHISTKSYPSFEGHHWDLNEKTDPVTPALRAEDALNPRDPSIAKARHGGITTACTLPGSTNVIGGTGICFKLKQAQTAEDMIIPGTEQLKMALGENPKRCYGENKKAPMTRMAIAAMIRETLYKAQAYAEAKKAAKKAGKPFALDFQLEPLVPALEGKRKVRIHCLRNDDIVTATKLVKEFHLNASLEHVNEGYMITDYLKKQKTDFVLGPFLIYPRKFELLNTRLSNAASFEKAGIDFCLTMDDGYLSYQLPVMVGMCIARGLSQETALRAVTINPAKLLKLDKRIGSIEVGKDADICIWSGNPFCNFSVCETTIIDGEVYSLADSGVAY